MAATAALPNDAFATADAGADYFATDAHYQSLANRILAVFRAGHSFVLVVKDATMSAELLGKALNKLAAPRHAVIEVTARPETTCDEVLRAAPERVLLPQRDPNLAAAAVPPGTRQPMPLFVLDDADRLSYEKLEQIYDALQPDDMVTPAVVLVAQEEFVNRLERPALRFLKEALSGQFRFTQLAREEVATYIHHQLRSTGTTSAFPAETIAAIADVAEGDASVVNRLARLVIDFAATSGTPAVPAAEMVEPAQQEAQIHEFSPRLQEVSPKLFDVVTPRAEPTPLPLHGRTQRSRAASILLKAFGEPGRPAATEPPILEATRRGGSLRRAPVGILVALAYIGVVSAASIGVFWILHPTAKNFVATGVRDINVALDQLRGNLFPPKPTLLPAQTAELAPASATAPIPPAASPPAPVLHPHDAPPAMPPINAAATPPAPLAPPVSPSVPPAATLADGSDRSAAVPPGPDLAAPSTAPSDPSLTATTSPDVASAAAPILSPLANADAVPTLSPDADERAAASDATTADSAVAETNNELDAVTPPAASATDQANLTAALPPAAVAPPATATTTSSVATAAPHLSAEEIANLLKRGNDFVGVGDIISARLYFERAADAGDARAAVLVGQTFDPHYLSRIGVFGVRGDATAAAEWYERARDLGDTSADARLKNLSR